MRWYRVHDLKNVMDVNNITGANGIFISDNQSIPETSAITFNTLNDFTGSYTYPDFSDRDIFSIKNINENIVRISKVSIPKFRGILITPNDQNYFSQPLMLGKYGTRTWDYGYIGYDGTFSCFIRFEKDNNWTIDRLNIGNKIIIDGINDRINTFCNVYVPYTLYANSIGDSTSMVNSIYSRYANIYDVDITILNTDGTLKNLWIIDNANLSNVRSLYFGRDGPRIYYNVPNNIIITENAPFRVNLNVQTNQDFECLNSEYGLILKSPNGRRWRVTIDDTGNLITNPL
ncbi:MAG: hypothetical protein ABIK75_07415 [candidate division WOR-3 bacterium]